MSRFLEYIARLAKLNPLNNNFSYVPVLSHPRHSELYITKIEFGVLHKLLEYIPFKLENVDQLFHVSILFH